MHVILSNAAARYFVDIPADCWLTELSYRISPLSQRLSLYQLEAIGGAKLLVGFRPDSILIGLDKKTAVVKDVVIAIYAEKLAIDNSYEALLHPAILNSAKTQGASVCA